MSNLLFLPSLLLRRAVYVKARHKCDCILTAHFFTLRFGVHSYQDTFSVLFSFVIVVSIENAIESQGRLKARNQWEMEKETKCGQQQNWNHAIHTSSPPHASPPSNSDWHRVLWTNLWANCTFYHSMREWVSELANGCAMYRMINCLCKFIIINAFVRFSKINHAMWSE